MRPVDSETCEQCGHPFRPHLIVATVLCADGVTPAGGHVYCQRIDCDCHTTWSIPDEVAGYDVKAAIEPLDWQGHHDLRMRAMFGDDFDGDDTEIWADSHSTLVNVHPASQCAGRPCVLHNPSDHHMREWPTNWRPDKRMMERVCPHGIGHPDPDDMAYHRNQGRTGLGVHGCDGCCLSNEASELAPLVAEATRYALDHGYTETLVSLGTPDDDTWSLWGVVAADPPIRIWVR